MIWRRLGEGSSADGRSLWVAVFSDESCHSLKLNFESRVWVYVCVAFITQCDKRLSPRPFPAVRLIHPKALNS